MEAGIIKYRLGDGLPNTEICPHNLNSKERQLRNSDLWTTYKVILVGFGISGAIFIAEVIFRHRHRFCGGKLGSSDKNTSKTSDDGMNNNNYKHQEGFSKGNYFTPPPPSYQTLFGQRNAQKKIVNGRDYWVYKLKDGDTRLVPVRTPSALLFQYTN